MTGGHRLTQREARELVNGLEVPFTLRDVNKRAKELFGHGANVGGR